MSTIDIHLAQRRRPSVKDELPLFGDTIDPDMLAVFTEVTISPAHSGFGTYDQSVDWSGTQWDDKDDLLSEIRNNIGQPIYELGAEALPDGLEDIQGRIYNQSGDIFGWLDEEGSSHYFAIVTHFVPDAGKE